jgi:hypothetical protein
MFKRILSVIKEILESLFASKTRFKPKYFRSLNRRQPLTKSAPWTLAQLLGTRIANKTPKQENRDIQTIEKQQTEISNLKRKLSAAEGEWKIVDGKRKYVIEEDGRKFQEDRHRNLGGLALQQMKGEGLEVTRTINGDKRGDLIYSKTRSLEDKEKLGIAIGKLQAKYNPKK